MAYPPVVIVDAKDQVIGAAPLADAWANSLIHRIAYVVVEDSRGRLLLQRRAPGMRLYPNCWDVAGGHVDVTPSYLETARLELQEEVGIEGVDLVEVGKEFIDAPYSDGTPAKRFIKIFLARYDGEPGTLAADEATEARWFTKEEVRELAAQPEQIADGLYRCLPYILEPYEDYQHQTTGQADRSLLGIR